VETVDDSDKRLFEREASLAALCGYADDALRGDGRLVLVSGEAGVGKSTLVERLQRELSEARWSWSACDGLFTPQPLGPLFDLADRLGGPLLDLCRAGAADRKELFRALLRQLSEPGVLDVVVVEDVHWADEATLDLLRFLGRRLREASALLIATYRDDALSADSQLRVVLGDLATQRSTRRMGLAPLSVHAVGMLAQGTGLDASELFRLTGGNPFYLNEVLQAGAGTVPPSARDAVLARAVRLGAESRSVLDIAALMGARVEWWLLESVTGCSPSSVDELLACGLLVGDGEWLRFRHEIARLSVEQAIAPHRSGAIHRRILDGLHSSRCDDEARLAFHAEASGDGPAVLRYAPAAARRAAELASHREAVVQFQRALRFRAGVDAPTLAGLYDGLADEMAVLDRFFEAADACEQALELWREAGDALREGDTLRRLAHTRGILSEGAAAVAAAEASIAVLEPFGPTVELAWAYATFARHQMLHFEHDEATRLALQAQMIAERIGALNVLSDALNTQAVCACREDRDWTAQMGRALQIALAGRHHEQAARAYANLCALYAHTRQFAEAEPYFIDGIAYCDEHDLVSYATFMRGERANVLDYTGRWDEAVSLSMEVLTKAGFSPVNQPCALRRLGVIRARRGEPDAWGYLDKATEAAYAAGQPEDVVAVRLARAEAYWLEGNSSEAMSEAERAGDLAADCDVWTHGAASVWLVRTGSARTPPGEVAEPYRLELEGDLVGAAEAWTRRDCPYNAALALSGATKEAVLRQALEICTHLGASATIRLIRQKLHLLGARSDSGGPRTSTRPFGLTKRELQVLSLICSAHTNAEIAQRLFIAAKTVDHHVSAILAKMGARNRNTAAHEAVRLGLVDVADGTEKSRV
jgi:DNA-binding CsgD family transcriptional regulator/tetratricopeptide (TPR) repeat protein